MLLAGLTSFAQNQDALLFYLSGEQGTTADYSLGYPYPNFSSQVSSVPDGAIGKGISCADGLQYAYKAPGNIYSRRGTLSFFWRSARPVTDIEFPIFRVSFTDHSSWDMCWLRMDWNGHGFDAFVTDNNLVRLRLSSSVPTPAADDWVHLAFCWDENEGVRLYVNGDMVAKRDTTLTLDCGLDQFGPHQRVISPYQVHARYNMTRGGDIDELRIYSQMLTPQQVAVLAAKNVPDVPQNVFPASEKNVMDGWKHTLGFDRQAAPYLENENTIAKRIGIHDAYDIKRWYWKSNDGILETTWPGVYNRSRIEGRNDYFQLPDWDCYYDSGKAVRYNMPEEPWNYVEVIGGAFGELGVAENRDGSASKAFANKPRGSQRSIFTLPDAVTGKTITFTNVEQETPIQEFDVFYVHEGEAPQGLARLSYTLQDFNNFASPELVKAEEFVAGRYEPLARKMLIGLPGGAARQGAPAGSNSRISADGKDLPIVHIVIPSDTRDLGINVPITLEGRAPTTQAYTWDFMRGGLDGILIELPALNIDPGNAQGLISLNVRVKDPIWKLRDMADFSFSVKPGEKRNLYIDLRDRILPEGKPFYLTLASGSPAFNAQALAGARISLVFKNLEEAKAEHVEDRLTQVVDNYAMMIEENTTSKRFDMFNRLETDMRDLFRVDPNNEIGRTYWNLYHSEQVQPDYVEPVAPKNMPEWAFMQLELLKEYRYLIQWYLDNREIEDGELGGGLSDDSDYVNFYPGFHAIGMMPDRLSDSLERMMQAIYDQGMLTDGLSTIMTDGLHTYEEGINLVAQVNIQNPGSPKNAERLMQSAKSYKERIFQVNSAGHLHVRSDYFSYKRIAYDDTWMWTNNRIYYHILPAMLLGELYGNTTAREYALRFMDSQLAHARTDANGRITIPEELNFNTDTARSWGINNELPPLYYCWLWTGDNKYLDPVTKSGLLPKVGDKETQVSAYRRQLRTLKLREFIYTEGSIWTDRVQYSSDIIQNARLGLPKMNRTQFYAPFNPISWRFAADEDYDKVAISVNDATNRSFSVDFYNTKSKPVKVTMKGDQALLGDWELTMDGKTRTVRFGRDRGIELNIPAGKEYSIGMRLVGDNVPFDTMPDLGIGEDDILVERGNINVIVHNIGAVNTAQTEIVLLDAKGKKISEALIPALQAPLDMVPKTTKVSLALPAGARTQGMKVMIDPQDKLEEIYESNNFVILK